MKETRVYLIDLNEVDDDFEPLAKTDEEFMCKSEELRTVYSLSDFQEVFNCDEISSDCSFIRILYV